MGGRSLTFHEAAVMERRAAQGGRQGGNVWEGCLGEQVDGL